MSENKEPTLGDKVGGIIDDIIDILGLGRSAYDKVNELVTTDTSKKAITDADTRALSIQDQRKKAGK